MSRKTIFIGINTLQMVSRLDTPFPLPLAIKSGTTPCMSIRTLTLGLLFVLIWSSAFTSGKFIVADAPPITA